MRYNATTIAILIITVLFVSAIAETIVYFNNVLKEKDSKIASLTTQIPNLVSQISILNSQMANLTSPNLVATLKTQEVPKFSQEYPGGPNYTIPYNFVQITGTVTNSGAGTAFNAGLHVVGYELNGLLVANVTVPLSSGYFGSDNATAAYSTGASQFGNLGIGQIANINESIIHEGAVYNWTATPVWSNSP